MRCPDCNKFVSYDDSQEPETNLDVSADGTEATVTGSVRIMLPCAECNTELKEYNFDVEVTVEIPEGHTGYTINDESCELTSRSDCGVNKRTGKPNKYNHRYATTYYGYSLTGAVKCDCGEVEVEFSASDETAASGMDELV